MWVDTENLSLVQCYFFIVTATQNNTYFQNTGCAKAGQMHNKTYKKCLSELLPSSYFKGHLLIKLNFQRK